MTTISGNSPYRRPHYLGLIAIILLYSSSAYCALANSVRLVSPTETLHRETGIMPVAIDSTKGRSSFDPNADFGAEKSTDILLGSYAVESDKGRKFVWVGATAKINLVKGAAKVLRLQGYVPFEMHQTLNHTKTFTVDVAVGDVTIGQIKVGEGGTKDGSIDASFDVAAIPASADGTIAIRLVPNSVLKPTSADERNLSFIISRIDLE